MADLDPRDLELLARCFPLKHFYYYRRLIGEKKLEEYFLGCLRAAPNPRPLFSKTEPGKLVGFASWNDSPWDSRNIGRQTARLNFLIANGDSFETQATHADRLYRSLETEFRENSYRYVFSRVNASDLPAVCVLQRNGYHAVDGLLTLSYSVKRAPAIHDGGFGMTVRKPLHEDMTAVKQIASTSFVYDRFHSDPEIHDSAADQLHANWIEDSFAKNADDRVLIAEKDGKVLGFISYSVSEKCDRELGLRILNIILLASHRESRNKNVAKALTLKVLELARQDHFDFVHVGTQLRNIKATNLYLKLGFQLVDTSYTLRKVLGGAPA
ncbi:MAG: GNAT family N-acetyltransferase [Nitrospinae bacterium]|nr:GNAT family N-acetyltransferase [Nitrospinota bacterium]